MKKFNCRILVTGCGGDIGQSIGKILNESVSEVYGMDISDKNAGKFIYKNFSIGVRCTDENYLSKLTQFITENQIDYVIPIAEPELRFLSKNKMLDNIGGAKLITASSKALEIGFDKLKTSQFLMKNELPFPETRNINEVDKVVNYPVILKSKTGSGSTDVYKVMDDETFQFLKRTNPDFIVQEYLEEKQGEFTCGVFKSINGDVRTMILKRELTGGYSGYGEVVEDDMINQLLISIANKLNLTGSINVQLRLTSNGPIVFEINPRFSSTVLFRHLFEFEDLIWSIEEAMKVSLSPYQSNAIGKKFYKGFNEYIL